MFNIRSGAIRMQILDFLSDGCDLKQICREIRSLCILIANAQ